jgi:hypothetical protein
MFCANQPHNPYKFHQPCKVLARPIPHCKKAPFLTPSINPKCAKTTNSWQAVGIKNIVTDNYYSSKNERAIAGKIRI